MDSTVQSSGLGEEEDLTGVQWHDKLYLTMAGLDRKNAMEYFSMSQFYNRACNNELVKMQNRDISLLEKMDGIEYGLEPCDEKATVFVITKRLRKVDPPSLTILATYYIIDGNVYQAPCAHVVLANRTTQALHHLRQAFASMQGATRLTPHGTHRWDPAPKALRNTADHVDAGVSRGEHSSMNAVLYDVLEKNRQIQDERQKMEAAAAANAQTYGADGGAGSGI